MLTEGVATIFANMNLEFLKNYAGIVMPERHGVPDIVHIDKDLIFSGDTFDILRY